MILAADRFWSKVDKTGDCWIWTGAIASNGYGSFAHSTAHRWAYTHLVGPVPDGMDLDHLCRVRTCCNPMHLEPVTRGENLRRGYAARGSAGMCQRGHAFTPENTGTNSRSGHRFCRACSRLHKQAYKKRRRAAVAATNPTQAITA
jgi:hypothetical protein